MTREEVGFKVHKNPLRKCYIQRFHLAMTAKQLFGNQVFTLTCQLRTKVANAQS